MRIGRTRRYRSGWLLALAASWAGCSGPVTKPPSGTPEEELRAKLKIPADAKRVIVLAQTAHLDIDWQRTFDDYYKRYVGSIFTEAGAILQSQPRAYYSVAEMAYLKHHVEAHPEELPALKSAAGRGALRIVGGGMTSPDTVLPETELILRDYLYGARFSEDTLGARAHSAWLPDSFGHAATVPDILSAVGLGSVGFARVDGAPTFLENLKHAPVRPGSTAETLQKLGSADFVWRGPGGASVLAHYMSMNLYCGGDNLDFDEQIQLPGGHLGVYYGDDPSFTDKQIDSYIAALLPYARTPYVFVPVGCDFQHPKDKLLDYLDGYDQRRYPSTGVYAVAATFEDYEQLVMAHQELLPSMEADLTPYFTGFYGTRADVKQGVRRSARPFFEAEIFATALGESGSAAMAAASPDFEKLTRADHHDFITGTANDNVVISEQLPVLAAAQAAGDRLLSSVASMIAGRIAAEPNSLGRLLALNPSGRARPATLTAQVTFTPPLADEKIHARIGGKDLPVHLLETRGAASAIASAKVEVAVEKMPPFSWQAIDLVPGLVPGAMPAAAPVRIDALDDAGQPAVGAAATHVVLSNEHVRAEWKRDAGFALVSLQVDGVEAIAAPSFLVRDATDSGGLWRIGSEMKGCAFTPLAPSVLEQQGESFEVLIDTSRAGVAFHSATYTREVWLAAGDTGLDLTLATSATMGQTRTAAFSFSVAAGAALRTSLAGGFAERAAEKLYTPTFWPAVGWASTGQWAVLLRQSTGVRFSSKGEVELMAVRDAEQESCDNEGGVGSDLAAHRIEWRIEHVATPAEAEQAAQAFNRPVEAFVVAGGGPGGDLAPASSLFSVTGAGILSTAKPADRGGGTILRALLLPGPVTVHLPPALIGKKLTRVDATERDLEELDAATDTLLLDRDHFGAIASVRLH